MADVPSTQTEQVETETKVEKKAKKVAAPPMYKITAAHTRLKSRVDAVQRTSSMFSEAPRIGTKILRPGTSVLLSDPQMKAMEVRLKMLVMAGAIEIEHLETGQKMTHKKVREMAKRELAYKSGKTTEEKPSKEDEELAAKKLKAEIAAEESALAKLAEEAAAKALVDAAKPVTEEVQPAKDAGTVDDTSATPEGDAKE